jgi:hypothetical protein
MKTNERTGSVKHLKCFHFFSGKAAAEKSPPSLATESVTEGLKDLGCLGGLKEEPRWGMVLLPHTTIPETGGPVTIEAKREYLAIVLSRYLKASSREEKSAIINEISANLRMHRKSAIRLLAHPEPATLQKGCGQGHKKRYSDETRVWLTKLWHRMGRMNSTKMREALPLWIPYYVEDSIPSAVKLELVSMSARTIERYLSEEKKQWRRAQNSGTRASRHIATVPLRNLEVQPSSLGHMEIDTVAHCGGSLTGTFAWTVTATDILTGWTMTRAVFGKDGQSVKEALFWMENECPFPWKAIYCDNGTEFLNDDVLYGYAKRGDGSTDIPVFRSRPYRKNDQAHVEQKNWTHVRELWGYERIGSSVAMGMMNSATNSYWNPLQNYFVPQQKVISNERHGSRRKRKVDVPQTPFERILSRADVPIGIKANLVAEFQSLNPFTLRMKLKTEVRRVFSYIDRSEHAPMRYAS